MATQTTMLENFVAGAWTPPSSDAYVDDLDPARPSDVLARLPLSSEDDVRRAVAAASDASPAWRATSPIRRGQILLRAGRALEERADELARLMTREQGKSLAEARVEVARASSFWGWVGNHGGAIQGMTAPTETDHIMALTLREPLGVVGLITPWNFPLNIPSWKLGSALICGNTVVLKPAQTTPLIAAALVEALAEAGIPDGVVNLVHGSGSVVGAALVDDPRVQAISFTGSTAVGMQINVRAAPLGKRVQAEMGGHNAVVVLADADVDRAASGCVAAAYGTTGQRCTAPRRIVAVRSVADELLERLAVGTAALTAGPGDQEGVDIGPLIDDKALDDVSASVAQAVSEGARIEAQGTSVGDPAGYFLAPTLLADVDSTMTIANEEVFGPVLPVIVVDDYAAAMEVALGTRYGLSTSIYTRDLSTAMRFLHDTDSGVVHVNKPPIGAESHLPFGGLKESGLGAKELGSPADFYTQSKTVFLDWSA